MARYGFLAVNKPKGITSFDVIEKVRGITGERQVGHGGTLDPFATGILLIAVGKTTRLLEYINHQTKTYKATLTLGAISDTFDCDGKIIPQTVTVPPSLQQINNIVRMYEGESEQTPPPFSAKHVDGKRAYDLARRKIDFQLHPQTIFIPSINILDYDYPILTLEVTCSSGTYVRSLAHDIGTDLTTGAYLSELTRTRLGDALTLDNTFSLDTFSSEKNIDSFFLTNDMVQKLMEMPLHSLSDNQITDFRNGKNLPITGVKPTWYILCMWKGNIAGVGKVDANGTSFHPEKVILTAG